MVAPSKRTFYVTTPIYYVTAEPHLGSLYSTLIADVIARWQKLQGKEVFFLTGTDEHGQKIAQAASKVGKEPQEFVDGFISAYKKMWHMYDIEYDHFIRTTDQYHIAAVQQWIRTLQKKGDIYKSFYHGWYCTPCETFVAEKTDDQEGASTNGPLCPSCNRPTEVVSEETYFFKLSAYQDKLLQFYRENPHFIVPKERMREAINFVKSGLKDLSISRTTVKWGIPFPDDPDHVVYVWAEALNNYITAIGYGQPEKAALFNHWWPAQVHVLGKDILRFHAIYWPAFLMAADLALPKQLLVHGWIKVDKQKMSKSLGNIVDPKVLYDAYGAEPVRYYLLRQLPITHDGEFSVEDLEQRITADLANDLGNLLNRAVQLAHKYDVIELPERATWSEASLNLRDEGWNALTDYKSYMEDYLFHMALARLWKFINQVNAYFHEQQPWVLAQQDKEHFMEVLSATFNSLRMIAYMLWPVMPHKMEQLLESIGTPFTVSGDMIKDLELNGWKQQFMLKKIPALFEKPQIHLEQRNALSEQQQALDTTITIDQFAQVQLLVGTIQECAAVPKSDKLLQLQVSFGDKGERTIVAGIKQWYTAEDLIGKQGVFVVNLKPRTIRGITSQGMMLFAEDDQGKLQFITVAALVPDGTRLQ